MEQRPFYTVRALSKSYEMGQVTVHALRDVDLDIREGEMLVLLGPSGSGKSTLLNIIGGMDSPTSGTVRLRETDIAEFTERELTAYRRDHVGFIFQFLVLLPKSEHNQVGANACLTFRTKYSESW
jgi:putative ABC transport system ATP-binding protein